MSDVLVQEIQVTCECGHKQTISVHNIRSIDTTECSCGSCHGESYEITFGVCEECGNYMVVGI